MKKKRKIRCKGKGQAFERVIAKDIVKAFRDAGFTVEQNDCWRSVLSGGHAMSAGDLRMSAQMKKLFPYAVECKFYKKIKLENLLLGNRKSKEVQWLAQTMEGSKRSGGLGALLVMKANQQKTLALRWISYDERKRLENYVQVNGAYWRVRTWKGFLQWAVKMALWKAGKRG